MAGYCSARRTHAQLQLRHAADVAFHCGCLILPLFCDWYVAADIPSTLMLLRFSITALLYHVTKAKMYYDELVCGNFEIDAIASPERMNVNKII